MNVSRNSSVKNEAPSSDHSQESTWLWVEAPEG